MSISAFIRAVLRLGIADDAPPAEARPATFINAVAALAMVACLPGSIGGIVTANGFAFASSLLLFCAFGVALWLSHRGHHDGAALYLAALATASMTVMMVLYGSKTGVHLFFIMNLIATLYGMGPRQSSLAIPYSVAMTFMMKNR